MSQNEGETITFLHLTHETTESARANKDSFLARETTFPLSPFKNCVIITILIGLQVTMVTHITPQKLNLL
jgi:hypothetical protein